MEWSVAREVTAVLVAVGLERLGAREGEEGGEEGGGGRRRRREG